MTRLLGLMLALVFAACWCMTAGRVAAGDKGTTVELDGLKSVTPKDWKKEEPSNKLRTAQFRVPKVDGDPKDAELVIFYFDKGGGGGTDANLDRWKKKFMTPDGKAVDTAKVEKFKVGEVKVTYLDIAGVYKLAPPGSDKYEKLADYRMFGVIFESPNGPYFITLTGPARTLEQQKKGFDDWLKGFK